MMMPKGDVQGNMSKGKIKEWIKVLHWCHHRLGAQLTSPSSFHAPKSCPWPPHRPGGEPLVVPLPSLRGGTRAGANMGPGSGFGALAAGNSEVVCVRGLWLEGGVLAVSGMSLWSQGPLPLGDGCGKKGPELGPRAESRQSETKDGVGNGLLKPHLILLTSTEI